MLVIKYCEIYYKNGNCIPYLELGYDDDSSLPNLKSIALNKEEDQYNSYFINLKYGFFDSLSKEILNILDNMFNSIGEKYLNKKLWKEYIKENFIEIPRINIEPSIAMSVNHKNDSTNKQDDIYKPILLFPNDENLKELYFHTEFPCSNNNYKVSKVLLGAKDEKELLYTFLYIIFNSNFSYDIIKCDNCHKYMLSTKSDTKYCERIYKDNLNCLQFSKYVNRIKRKSNSSRLDKLRQHVYDNIKKREDFDLKGFHEKEKEMLKQFFDNEIEKKKFYLSYYSTERGRRRNDYAIK